MNTGYQDMVIDVGPDRGAGHTVRILDSPAGEARGTFTPPLTPGELRRFLAGLATSTRRLAPFVPSGASLSAREVGGRLFEALFRGPLRDCYIASVHRAATADQGLRIRIRLDPADPDPARLHSLPWEFLYRSDTREFLARSRRAPIVRYLDVPQPAALPPAPRPLRILMVTASPRGLPDLDLKRERKNVEAVWREHQNVEVIHLPRATLGALREALLAKDYHALHFMGHGDFTRSNGEGVLYFEDDEGKAEAVAGEALADEIRDFPSLRLVLLNACHSAEATDPQGRNPFAGIATALVHGGVGAVVAMQAPISDRAAIAFSRELYHRLAADDPIDAAVVEGRRAIGRPGRSDEWGVPVLFLRSRTGRLFEEPPADQPPIGRPPVWSWSKPGLAYLIAGGLGLALLIGLGSLLLRDQAPWREAAAITAGALAVFWGALAGHDPARGHRLSHWIARHRAARWCLAGLGLTSLVAWGLAGRPALEASACGPLGAAPPGVRRVLLAPFADHLTQGDGLGAVWAEDTVSSLAQKLSLVEALQPLDAASQLTADRARRCVDIAIRGTVRSLGEDIVLSARLSRRGGVHLATVEVQGAPDDAGETILHLQNRLAIEILEDLDLPPDGELRRRISGTPTDDPEALRLNRLGVASFLGGDLLLAEIRFEAARKRDPGYADAVNNLAMVKLRRGETADADALLNAAIELLPRHPSYHFNLGLALDRSGHLEAAVAAYERAVELDPSHSPAFNNLGFVLLELGEPVRARESLRLGLANAQDPRLQATLYKNLGREALARAKPRESLEHLDKALERVNSYPEALFYRAVARQRLGEGAAACAGWKTYNAFAGGGEEEAERRLAAARYQAELGCPEENG